MFPSITKLTRRLRLQKLSHFVIITSFFLALVFSSPPLLAKAAPLPTVKLPPGVAKGWNPANDAIFTGPGDDDAVKRLDAAIDAAPRGATIELATYAFSDLTLAKKLVKAHVKRGVNVKLTSTTRAAHANKKVFKMFKKAFGSNTAKRSYLNLCRGSCYLKDNDGATSHAKIVTVSEVVTSKGKRVRHVIFIGSANFSMAAIKKTWNHTQVIVGCAKAYAYLTSYMDGMRYDRTKRNFKPLTACGYTFYLYPSAKMVHPAVTAFNQVKCMATKAVKATKKHKAKKATWTSLVVMMYVWPSSQKKVAEKLAKLARQRCRVTVIVSSGTTSKTNIRIMKKAGIKVQNARIGEQYLHAKLVGIKGRVGKKLVNLAIFGSANFSVSAARYNTEVQVSTNNASLTNEIFDFAKRVQKHISKKK